MKKIYISGPITGLDYKKAKDNFEDAEKRITEQGHMAVNPMRLLPEGLPYEHYMKTDIAALLTCDAIFMLDGFNDSTGALLEREIARIVGIDVVYDVYALPESVADIKDDSLTMLQEFVRKNPMCDPYKVIACACPHTFGLSEKVPDWYCKNHSCGECWARKWKGTDSSAQKGVVK